VPTGGGLGPWLARGVADYHPDDPLDVTLASYEAAAERYRDALTRPQPAWLAFLDAFTTRVAGGHVLEVGSGPGREALLLEDRGLTVTRSDATAAFVVMMAAAGHAAQRIDVRVDPLGGPYDGIFANAVLLHLAREQLAPVLRRLRAAVRTDGTLGVSLKEGDGEEQHARKLDLPRHFTYWREAELRSALAASGWRVLSVAHEVGRSEPAEPWLYVLAAAG
jgi:SAM-dependent methyltransferase